MITKQQALKRAKKYCLEFEVQNEMDCGATPWQALYEWDLLEKKRI